MAKQFTKAELQESLDDHAEAMRKLEDQLRISQAETNRFQRDAQRAEDHSNDLERRLQSISTAISTVLATKHGKKPEQEGEWFRGEVVEEGVTEEVRTLRYLHGLTQYQPPF